MRSEVTSRSNWAKDSSTLSVSRPMRGGGVEGLGDGDERHLMGVEELDQLGEVGQRAGQAIDLVDHDDVDLAGADVGEQPLQGGPVHRAAGKAAIVIGCPDQRSSPHAPGS